MLILIQRARPRSKLGVLRTWFYARNSTRIARGADERFDLEVLFERFEQQSDLPPSS
jgi:hypothetical protein